MPALGVPAPHAPSLSTNARITNTQNIRNVFSLSNLPRVASPAPTKRQSPIPENKPAQPPPPQRPAQTATHTRGTTHPPGSTHPPADLVTNTLVTMAGRASTSAGNAAGRYNLRPRGRRGQGGLRGAAALANSPLLGRLLEDLAAVFDAEVLPLLDPATRALLGRVGQACRDAVLRSPKLPCAGRTVGVTLKISKFVGSIARLTWARDNGCPWNANTCCEALGADTWRC